MVPDSLRRLAESPPRAWGDAVAKARLRATPEDFVVDEILGFEPAGAGAHVLLRVRKRDANTDWVARELARLAGCRPSEVGYAGLKDRRALVTQWFSVPRSAQLPVSWASGAGPGFEVLEAHAHARKLPRAARLELHPTGALWGQGAPRSRGEVHALECRVAADLAGPCALVESAGMHQERRALRLAVRDFTWRFEPGALVLGFRLARGAFATAVLAEIIGFAEAAATFGTGSE